MRNYENEIVKRICFIREVLQCAGASGIVYGNSGGKDSALVGILCKRACDNTLGIIMPCGASRNYTEDADDARSVALQFGIETRVIDLGKIRGDFTELLCAGERAASNIAPRLRMTSLYTVAANENRLVAGTGNRSEGYMGYFTKWGDGAYDFNPIADLTVTEIYEFLRFLGAPERIIVKAPSAGLFDDQTDEKEMGVTYRQIDDFILKGTASKEVRCVIERFHSMSEHKRKMPYVYSG